MGLTTNILIVDDHPLMRDALDVASRKACGECTNIIHADTIIMAKDVMKTAKPDLILLDLHLSDTSGFDGLNKIKSSCTTPIMIVTAQEGENAVQTAQALGAKGYLKKSQSLDDMITAIQTVIDGNTSFPEMSDVKGDNDALEKISRLTPAQNRVVGHLSDGLLNKQIAYEMGISEATVKAHMTAIFRKLGANNRTQALLVYKEAIKV